MNRRPQRQRKSVGVLPPPERARIPLGGVGPYQLRPLVGVGGKQEERWVGKLKTLLADSAFAHDYDLLACRKRFAGDRPFLECRFRHVPIVPRCGSSAPDADDIASLRAMTDRILARAADGGRITPEEAILLYDTAPLEELGAAADEVVRRRFGDEITYNVNAHLNPTNICVVGCGFCAFAVWTEKDERAYAYSVDQLVERAGQLVGQGITELHIVGGMTKEYDLPYYEELFSELKGAFPNVALTALTAVEIDFIARMSKVSHREALERTRAAGHDTMPGGGAEVFSSRVREIIADRKVPAETWLEVHREAHGQGMRTNATLLFGHFETPAEQVDHMDRLRDLQDETGGFQAFIPLPF